MTSHLVRAALAPTLWVSVLIKLRLTFGLSIVSFLRSRKSATMRLQVFFHHEGFPVFSRPPLFDKVGFLLFLFACCFTALLEISELSSENIALSFVMKDSRFPLLWISFIMKDFL